MYVTLNLVMLLCSYYHRKFSVLLTLLVFPYFSLGYSIYCYILPYTLLAASSVYIFVTIVEGNFGGNIGG